MFDVTLPIYFFTKEHPLKTSNKRTQIPLLIDFITFINFYLSISNICLFR